MIKSIQKSIYFIGCLVIFFFASQCCASAEAPAVLSLHEQEMLQAAAMLKRQLDREWRRVAYIEEVVHNKFSTQVHTMLYGRKQYQELFPGGIYPISYSFMVERADGAELSEFLVQHVLSWTYLAPQQTAAVLGALARQAVEDNCVPYLNHILAHPLYPKEQLPQLHELASCAEREGVKVVLDEYTAKLKVLKKHD